MTKAAMLAFTFSVIVFTMLTAGADQKVIGQAAGMELAKGCAGPGKPELGQQ